jgi:uncharacterized protein
MLALSVEIHDVAPPLLPEVLEIRAALSSIGVDRPTLLAVPLFVDESGAVHDLRRSAATVRFLREEAARGAEVVQHGLTHRAPAPPPPGLASTLLDRFFADGCAEFAHLSRGEARARLELGREILSACGLEAHGFVAPAWLTSEGARTALVELGFAYTARLGHFVPLDGSPPIWTPALTFVAPVPAVDYGKRLVMLGLEAAARRAPLLRVAIHPQDLHGARPLPHILSRVRALLGARRLVTAAEWLAARRVARAA